MKYLPGGFVFRELFITLAVILGLFALAFPAYHDYMRRDYYKEIVEATTPFKLAVNKCFKKLKTFTGCNTENHLIPAYTRKSHSAVASINVVNGVITVVPVAQDGILTTDTYVLTPKIVNDELTWMPSGNGLSHGYTG